MKRVYLFVRQPSKATAYRSTGSSRKQALYLLRKRLERKHDGTEGTLLRDLDEGRMTIEPEAGPMAKPGQPGGCPNCGSMSRLRAREPGTTKCGKCGWEWEE